MLARSVLDSRCVNIQFGIREHWFAALVGFTLPVVQSIPSPVVFALSRKTLMISKTRTQNPDTDKILPVSESEASLLYRLASIHYLIELLSHAFNMV